MAFADLTDIAGRQQIDVVGYFTDRRTKRAERGDSIGNAITRILPMWFDSAQAKCLSQTSGHPNRAVTARKSTGRCSCRSSTRRSKGDFHRRSGRRSTCPTDARIASARSVGAGLSPRRSKPVWKFDDVGLARSSPVIAGLLARWSLQAVLGDMLKWEVDWGSTRFFPTRPGARLQ